MKLISAETYIFVFSRNNYTTLLGNFFFSIILVPSLHHCLAVTKLRRKTCEIHKIIFHLSIEFFQYACVGNKTVD